MHSLFSFSPFLVFIIFNLVLTPSYKPRPEGLFDTILINDMLRTFWLFKRIQAKLNYHLWYTYIKCSPFPKDLNCTSCCVQWPVLFAKFNNSFQEFFSTPLLQCAPCARTEQWLFHIQQSIYHFRWLTHHRFLWAKNGGGMGDCKVRSKPLRTGP